MRAVLCLKDSRIDAFNVLFEVEIGEYSRLVAPVLKKNEFQRKRVSSSKTVYSLLRHDLRRQCVIPPVVLALTASADGKIAEEDLSSFEKFLDEHKESMVILDGLQRTYTILDVLDELKAAGDQAELEELLRSKIRMEVYFGINRLGILYRMLTLNTGQTPMSLRQQIEILYLDYLDKVRDGIELIREADGKSASGLNQYNFKDIVEGFNSYLDRDELPIDKSDLLENIGSLEKLSKENQSTELFEEYLKGFSAFINRLHGIAGDVELGQEYLYKNGSPFGRNFVQVFKKPQVMSGFGAAIGRLIDFDLVKDFDEVIESIGKLSIEDPAEALEEVNSAMAWLKDNAKKIGNAQRSYFSYFFRELFNAEGDAHLDIIMSSKAALRKYQGQNM
jgi:hypothetical protein